MSHQCDVPGCDGTRLGHDLAVEFPRETARVDEAFDRLAHPDDYLRAPTSRPDVESPSVERGEP
jgi:hypothetical protein